MPMQFQEHRADRAELDAPVEVVAAFNRAGTPEPRSFHYGQKRYSINSINLSYAVKQGANRLLVFHVSDDGGDRTLTFDTGTLQWKMHQT